MTDQKLRYVGYVLVAVGLIDVAILAVCIALRISYMSPFSIPVIVAGVFLVRGSKKAARLVRHSAALILASMVTLFILLPFHQPLSLTMAVIRTDPIDWMLSSIAFTAIAVLLAWIVVQLGQAEKGGRIRLSASVGSIFTIVVAGITFVSLHSKTAQYAEILAQEQVGSGYSVSVSSLKIETSQFGKNVSAKVNAWDEREVKQISVSWRE